MVRWVCDKGRSCRIGHFFHLDIFSSYSYLLVSLLCNALLKIHGITWYDNLAIQKTLNGHKTQKGQYTNNGMRKIEKKARNRETGIFHFRLHFQVLSPGDFRIDIGQCGRWWHQQSVALETQFATVLVLSVALWLVFLGELRLQRLSKQNRHTWTSTESHLKHLFFRTLFFFGPANTISCFRIKENLVALKQTQHLYKKALDTAVHSRTTFFWSKGSTLYSSILVWVKGLHLLTL